MKSGFVSIVGRPNAGKSTLLNWLLGEKIALVSHKANATRKRANAIVMHKDSQIIFVDTPGIHQRERLLNQFMLAEVIRAIGDCDLILFLSVATDSLKHYEKFLELNSKNKKHILLISKVDTISNRELLELLSKFSKYEDRFLELIPISTKEIKSKEIILDSIKRHLPESNYFFDTDILTTEKVRDIYREFIRESIFENVSDEIPYESDVIIEKMEELEKLDRVFATIVIEKNSQKLVIVGKSGSTIKRIGKYARELISSFSGKKVYLELFVKVQKGWSKNRESLSKFGYEF